MFHIIICSLETWLPSDLSLRALPFPGHEAGQDITDPLEDAGPPQILRVIVTSLLDAIYTLARKKGTASITPDDIYDVMDSHPELKRLLLGR
jgi:hypothetical protein